MEQLTETKDIKARVAKFKRRAHMVIDADHLCSILLSFPEDQRRKIFDDLLPTLGFKVWPFK